MNLRLIPRDVSEPSLNHQLQQRAGLFLRDIKTKTRFPPGTQQFQRARPFSSPRRRPANAAGRLDGVMPCKPAQAKILMPDHDLRSSHPDHVTLRKPEQRDQNGKAAVKGERTPEAHAPITGEAAKSRLKITARGKSCQRNFRGTTMRNPSGNSPARTRPICRTDIGCSAASSVMKLQILPREPPCQAIAAAEPGDGVEWAPGRRSGAAKLKLAQNRCELQS